MSSPLPQADPWHATTQSRRSFFLHFPVRLHITSRVSLFFFVFVFFWHLIPSLWITNDNEEEQDLTAAAGEGNTKQALRACNLRDKCLEETRRTSSPTRAKGASNRIRSVSEYGIRNKQGFLLFFRGNLENFNPYWANARDIRIARAIELKSESKILQYQKQIRILLFFRRKLTYSIGARNFTKIVEIV